MHRGAKIALALDANLVPTPQIACTVIDPKGLVCITGNTRDRIYLSYHIMPPRKTQNLLCLSPSTVVDLSYPINHV